MRVVRPRLLHLLWRVQWVQWVHCGDGPVGRLRHPTTPLRQPLWVRDSLAEEFVGVRVLGERGVQLLNEMRLEA